jgi:hypothetical protein
VEVSGVSQPLDALPSQLPKPGLQVKLHIPALHVVVALARAGQALPQEPQLLTSVAVSTQDIPQRTWPPEHPLTQRPVIALHTGEAPEQEAPHEPQFEAVPSGVSQPFIGLPSQSAKPALQLAIPQVPIVHEGVPFITVQARLHIPQCKGDSLRLASQPFIGLPSQSA